MSVNDGHRCAILRRFHGDREAGEGMIKPEIFMQWFAWVRGNKPAPVRRKLRTRLLMTLIPTSLIVLALMGYATYWASSEFISVALERNSRIHAATTAQAVESLLERYKRLLLFVARKIRPVI
jgi:hypothetical protein